MQINTTPETLPAPAIEERRKIVIAAGCPHSGWDIALPALHEGGLTPLGEPLSDWHEEVFQRADISDPLKLRQPLQPDDKMADRAMAVLAEAPAQTLLLSDSRGVWLLDFWATRYPDARFVLFFTPVESALAYALIEGVDPHQYLQDWQAANQLVIHFLSRHRQRAILLDAEAASRQPHALIDPCGHIGLILQSAPERLTPDSKPAPHPPLLERLLASQLISRLKTDSHTLHAELEARAQPLGDAEQSPESELGAILDAYFSERQSTRGLESAKKELEQENELLLIQLHQVQEELEHYFLKYQEVERTAQVSEEKIGQLERELAGLRENVSWRDTHPIRAIGKSLSIKAETRKHVKLLKASGLFDDAWYLAEYPDVADAGIDPVAHYLNHGAAEGRNPSSTFDTRFYLESNPDVAAAGMNPLIHFVKFGRAEGRTASRKRI